MRQARRIGAGLAAATTLASLAVAQPTITSLGSGTPIGVSSLTGGNYYVSGSGILTSQIGRWTYNPGMSTITPSELGGAAGSNPVISADGAYQLGVFPNTSPQIFGKTATGVSPVFRTDPTLVASTTTPSTTDTIVNRWSSSSSTWTRLAMPGNETRLCYGQTAGGVHMMTFGPGSGGFFDGNAISQNGRFVAGHTYISSYSTSTGNTITASVGRWHPVVWDANSNVTTVLPTAARTSSNTWRPRTARAFAVSNDGQVVVGYQEHNVGSTASPDPDGSRPLVWRWNSGTSQYDMDYLPTANYLLADSPNIARVCCNGTTCTTVTDPMLCTGTIVYNGTNTSMSCTTTPLPCSQTMYACCNGDVCTVVAAGTCTGTTAYQATATCTASPCRTYVTAAGSANATIFINAAGTVIVGRNFDATLGAYMCKWTWNSGTSSWDTSSLGTNVGPKSDVTTITCPSGTPTVTTAAPHGLSVNEMVYISSTTTAAYNGMWMVSAVPSATTFEFVGTDGSPKACAADSTDGSVHKAASWLPSSVTFGCGPTSNYGSAPSLSVTGMSDDGNTVVGSATYSTCGSFMTGGWIWHSSDNTIKDWYDYCVATNVPGVTTYYAPIDANSQPTTIGLPRLGNPTSISADGTAIVGRQGGTQIVIPSAGPWIYVTNGGATCVAPQFVVQPAATVNTSLCAFTSVTLNVAASGTGPLSYQWYKDTGGGPVAVSDGPTGFGSTITGSTTVQFRINQIRPSDVGTYTCVVTGCNSQTATSTGSVVALDSTQVTPSNNDCALAVNTGEGTVNWNICASYLNQGSSCATDFASVWYRYTPTFTGFARFQTCASTFDTTITLYDMCNGSQLMDGCNDDVGSRGLAGLGSSCTSTKSVISSYPVVAGVPIYVRVGAKTFPFSTTNSSVSGAMTISQAPAAPANDLCSGATVALVGSPNPFNVNEATDDFTIGVSGDGGVSTFCAYGVSSYGTASNRDVWFLLDSPCHTGGTYTIDTCGSTMTNPMLHVFFGDCTNGLQLLGNNVCADSVGSGVAGCSSQQARISNLVTTGPVYIRVSQSGTSSPGTAATSGTGVLNINGTHNVCGACCDTLGACTLETAGTCGGTYNGDGSTCSPANPCIGVCCRGSTCTNMVSAAACQTATTTNSTNGPGWSFSAIDDCNTPVSTPGSLGNTTSPCCYANYNHNATLEVQDIFDFLNDWFAGNKMTLVGGDGTNGTLQVQNIFDFLNAWFAGGCI